MLIPVCGGGKWVLLLLFGWYFAPEGGSHRAVILPNGSDILMVTCTVSGECTQIANIEWAAVRGGQVVVVCSGCTDNVDSNQCSAAGVLSECVHVATVETVLEHLAASHPISSCVCQHCSSPAHSVDGWSSLHSELHTECCQPSW